jgi:hypothetical protein
MLVVGINKAIEITVATNHWPIMNWVLITVTTNAHRKPIKAAHVIAPSMTELLEFPLPNIAATNWKMFAIVVGSPATQNTGKVELVWLACAALAVNKTNNTQLRVLKFFNAAPKKRVSFRA